MDASPARLISSRALFSVYGPINYARRHVKGRLSPSLLLLCMAAPDFKEKKQEKQKITVPEEHHSRSWTSVRDISISQFENDNTSTVTGTAASKGEDILLVLRHSMFCFFHLL